MGTYICLQVLFQHHIFFLKLVDFFLDLFQSLIFFLELFLSVTFSLVFFLLLFHCCIFFLDLFHPPVCWHHFDAPMSSPHSQQYGSNSPYILTLLLHLERALLLLLNGFPNFALPSRFFFKGSVATRTLTQGPKKCSSFFPLFSVSEVFLKLICSTFATNS